MKPLRAPRQGQAPPLRRRASGAAFEFHVLVLVTLGLVAFGLVMVFSASSGRAAVFAEDPAYYLKRQSVYALLGLVALVVFSRLDLRAIRGLGPPLLGTSFVLLVAVLALGTAVNGARRWLSLGFVEFQPSELAKLALALWLAAFLARRRAPRSLGELARPAGLVVLAVCALILLEPDLGTSLAIVIMAVAMLVVAGTPMRVLASAGGILAGLALAAIWLEPYRRARLMSFLDPWADPEGTGFQTVQAMIALGSGGVFGVGLGESVQKVNYLPESTTDMIFAIIGEELGLLGAFAVVAAFVAFAYAGFNVALRARDPFAKLLAAGITALIAGQAVVNLSAVLGIAPLTGIPLPFVSYGGSSLIVTLASVGILLNIAANGGARKATAQVPDRRRRDGRTRDPVARGRRGAQAPRRERHVRRRAAG
jgi:cell division protein FtsW